MVAEHDVVAVGHQGGLAHVRCDLVVAGATEDDVPAGTGEDDVGPAIGRLGGLDAPERERMTIERHCEVGRAETRRRTDQAGVAEHDVVRALSDVERVLPEAAEHDVAAATGYDRVAATDRAGGIVGAHPVDVVRIAVVHDVVDEADIAENKVLTIHRRRGFTHIGRDGVAAEPAEDDVATDTGGDGVDPAILRPGRLDAADRECLRERGAGNVGTAERLCRLDQAAVAQHDVRSCAGRDRVLPESAEHDVAAAAGDDGIVAARSAYRVVCSQPVDVVRRAIIDDVIDVAEVAEHDVAAIGRAGRFARVRRDRVVARAAENDVAASAGGDAVGPAIGWLGGFDASDGERLAVQRGGQIGSAEARCRADETAVAEHDVVRALAGDDGVSPETAEHDVALAAGGDVVVAAERTDAVVGAQAVDVVQVLVVDDVVDEAEVAEHDVAILAGIDHVRPAATQDQVRADAALDAVRDPVRRLRRRHAGHRAGARQPQRACKLIDHAMVAEHDVCPGIAEEGVHTCHQVVAGDDQTRVDGRHGQQARHRVRLVHQAAHRQVEVEARITVDVVVAALPADPVVAGTAGNLVVELAAVDRVLAAAAVDGDPAAGRTSVDDVVTGVGKHHAVAGECPGVGPGVVARTVLRRVAIDHQRRAGAATAGDGDGVPAHRAVAEHRVATAMDHGHDIVARPWCARARGGDVELVVALAQQHFGDLDVVERDATRNHQVSRAILGHAGVDGERPALTGDGVRAHAQTRQIDRPDIVGQVRVAELDDVVAQFHPGHPALVVGPAGIVEHREAIGLPGFVDLVRNGDRDRGDLRGQHHRRAQRPVLAFGHATFDDQRPRNRGHHVVTHGLLTQVGLGGIRREGRIRLDRHLHFLEPVGAVEDHGLCHALHADRHAVRRHRQQRRRGQRERRRGDRVDLVPPRIGPAQDVEPAARGEAVGQPATAIAAHDAVAGGHVDGACERGADVCPDDAVCWRAGGVAGLSVAVQVDRHRRSRGAGKAHGVVVAGHALDDPRPSIGFRHDDPRRVVVEHLDIHQGGRRIGVPHVGAGEGVRDARCQRILAHGIVHRLHG